MKKIICSLLFMAAMVSCTQQAETPTATADDAEVVEKVMMSRRSIRQYTDKRISRDTLNHILECGINAPNGQNRQAYEIRVVDNPGLLAEITTAVVNDNKDNAPKNGAKNIFVNATCVVFKHHPRRMGKGHRLLLHGTPRTPDEGQQVVRTVHRKTRLQQRLQPAVLHRHGLPRRDAWRKAAQDRQDTLHRLTRKTSNKVSLSNP